jgi:DNA-binding GntR family transcriptional regulator
MAPVPRAGSQAPGRSATSHLIATIRADIIHGAYRPGERLVEEALAQEHGVSRIPVREALRVLEAEGFIRVKPYSGTFVAEMGAADATDLLDVRNVLEPLAAAKAATNRTSTQLASLLELVAQGRAAVRERRYHDLSELNGRFHVELAMASGNASLSQFIWLLRNKIDWLYGGQVQRRAKDSWQEHAEIVSAIDARDAVRAEALARRHIEHSAEAFERRLRPPAR